MAIFDTIMPASSVGSNLFALASLAIISLLVLLLLRHYLPLRTTPLYLLIPVFLALALPCSIILLVPIDLASASSSPNKHGGVWLPEHLVLVTWRITYWLTFCLTWFILPLLGEYVDSGYRDGRGRMLYSLRSNARYQLIYLGTGVAGSVYFIMQNGLHVASIKGLVMALAYAWGLVLAISLMGHGLVALPRRLFKNARVSDRLQRLQTRAPMVKEKLDEAAEELEELENTAVQLKARKNGTSRDLQDWIDELAETTTVPDRPGAIAGVRATNASIPAVVTERYLADLTRKLKRARHKKARFEDEWSHLVQHAHDAQTILDSATTQSLDFGRSRATGPFSRIKVLTPRLRFYLYSYVLPYARIALAVLLAIASIIVVYSELTKFAPHINIIALSIIHNTDTGKITFPSQLLAAFWLLYMCASALYAISDVKVWGNRALVKRQTYAESACWYSLQVAKLTVPLSYNFITMLPAEIYTQTSFYQFLGKLINLTPLGASFSKFFPLFLLVPVLASLFNVYGRLKSWIGFGMMEDESEENASGFGTSGWREGRSLIEREIQARGGAQGASRPYTDEATVGLMARNSASLDLERGASTPALITRGRAPAGREDAGVETARRQFNSITSRAQSARAEEEEEDGARHFYQDFAERVRNTIDTADTPEWIQGVKEVLKTPKWMRKDDAGGSGDGPGAALSKWFGGGQDDGRVRL